MRTACVPGSFLPTSCRIGFNIGHKRAEGQRESADTYLPFPR
jgi:hypothetical protein